MITKKLFQINRIFIISTILALVTIIFLFITVSFPLPSQNSILIQKPFVSFKNLDESDVDEILKDQALIFDTKPILLPTKWSEKQIHPNEEVDRPLFQDLPTQTILYNYATLSNIMLPEYITISATDILSKQFLNSFEGINQDKPILASLNIPKMNITVKNLNDSKIIENYEIDKENPLLQKEFWAPLEFLVIVDESGPIMPLFVSQSSGIEDIDIYFKNYISDPILKLSHLPKGYYKIGVSP